MRQDVAFKTLDGLTLRGWFYAPDAPRPWPVVVMAHGFSAVKEMYLDAYAEVFAAAGLAVLVYDNRHLGASDGFPRQEIDGVMQVRDYQDAITYAENLPGVDPDRIGIWGSSFSGGHVLVVGALDRRVKCVVSQVPGAATLETLRMTPKDHAGRMREERRLRLAGEAPTMIPVVSDDPAVPCVLPTADSWTWFTETARQRAPAWRNEVTLLSRDLSRMLHPGDFAAHIAPTPLLMLVAENDVVTPTASAVATYHRAREPKRLQMLSGGHFDPYVSGFDESSAAARDWFVRHLYGRQGLGPPPSPVRRAA